MTRVKPGKVWLTRICETCSAKFQTRRCYVTRGAGKFCTKGCYAQSLRNSRGRNWRGGTMEHRGYVLQWAPHHPNSRKGYVYQHRLRMEKSLGRLLTSDEVVHHKNHNIADNRVKNLEVMTRGAHTRGHKRELSPPIFFRGEKIMYQEAIDLLGINRSSFFDMRKRHGLSHQETFKRYLKKLGIK